MVRVAANPAGPLKLLFPLVNRIGQHVWDKRLAGIKAALEAPASCGARPTGTVHHTQGALP
jgi:hypothetical protein